MWGDPVVEERAKRKLTAILSADVKGYSRLMGEDELSTVETLKQYREIISSLVQQYSGRVVDFPGDNILAEFSSVVDAVECAVKIQGDLQENNANLPENRRMEFRIGVNLGDVIDDEGRIYGDGVNVAARVERLAEGGGICISRKAFNEVKNKLKLGYENLGEHSVKNIVEPVRVYKVLMEPEYAGRVIGEKRRKSKKWPRTAIAAVAILLVLAGAFAIWNFYFRPPSIEPASVDKMAFPLPDKPSIAVLPFVNMSDDPKQEFFCDGVTEEIITGLSKVPELFVIARNSVFTYKGKPVKVQKVAEDLGVRYVLEGSVRKFQENLRITAQLVDAVKGHHLWADRWDRELKDVFAVQDEITMKITTAMQVELTAGELARIVAKGTNNIDAYLKALEANENVARFNQESNARARQLAKEAIELDPRYAFAYTLLGKTHMFDVLLGISSSPKESIAHAIELAQRAINLDESIGRARGLLGFLYIMTGQHEKGIIEAEKAVTLEPSSDLAHQYLGLALRFGGKPNEAIPVIKKAIRLNPFGSSTYLFNLGLSYLFTGQYEEAIAACEKATTREPNNFGAQLALTVAYGLSGHEKEARTTASEVLRLNPKFSIEYYSKTLLYKNQDDKDRFIDALRKAGLPENPPLPLPDKPSIAVLPFVNMSDDPEQEYFSDGITEEIITALSKTPKLFVIARNSTFTYKGKPVKVQQVGRELGVKYVLEGSVRKAENQVRITAQLVDAQTGHHLWAERYDRYLKDIFVLQDEITKGIITALQVKLTVGEGARLLAKGTKNIPAYLKLLQGTEYLLRMNKECNILARKMAEQVIDLDPEYPRAYRLLAITHWFDAFLRWSNSPGKSLRSAEELAQKVLAMDESDSISHRLLGYIYLLKKEHDKAIAEAERAVAIDPNASGNLAALGFFLNFAGRPEEAIVWYKKAIRLDPIPAPLYYLQLGHIYRNAGRYEEAISELKKALYRNPDNLLAHLHLASAYSSLGREEEAQAETAEVFRIDSKFSLDYWSKTIPYRNQADKNRLIEALRKAGIK